MATSSDEKTSQSQADAFIQRLPSFMNEFAHLLMVYGVGYQEADQLLQAAFYEASLDKSEKTVNFSRVALRSGLARRKVRELSTQAQGQNFRHIVGAIGRVVHIWRTHTNYIDPDGKPRILPRKGYKTMGFNDLVLEAKIDIPFAAALKEMEQRGIISFEDEQVILVLEHFVASPNEQMQMDVLIENLSTHVEVVRENVDQNINRVRFERSARVSSLTEQRAADIEKNLSIKMQSILEDVVNDSLEQAKGDEDGDFSIHLGMYIMTR